MTPLDPLAEIRDLLEAPRHLGSVPQEKFERRETIGIQPRFKGKQEIRVLAVGHASLDRIILETLDLKGSTWISTRWIPVEVDQVPALLKSLLEAEAREADIKATQGSDWPAFPIPLADIPCKDGGVLKVSLAEYQGYVDVNVSKAFADGVTRRNNLWLKISPSFDVRPLGALIINAYDKIHDSANPEGETAEDPFADATDF